MKTFQLPRSIVGAILTLALSISFSTSAEAWQGHRNDGPRAPYKGIVAFGDSLTDTGNIFTLTEGAYPPAPYYYNGRFSDGLIWIDYLSAELKIRPERADNYAVGGATTGRENSNDIPGYLEFPGLQDQLDAFEENLDGKRADKRSLFVIWAGGNDFYIAEPSEFADTIATGVQNTVAAVVRLHNAGARHIMVVNMPDLGKTPYGNEPFSSAFLSYISASYNTYLDSALDELAVAGIETKRMDASGVLQEAVAEPDRFGFLNVTDSYLDEGVGNSSDYLFLDIVHPTTGGHYLLAKEAMRVLDRKDRHIWGTPASRH